MSTALAGDKRASRQRPRTSADTVVLMGVPSPGATGGGPALHVPMLVDDLRGQGVEVVPFGYGRWAENEGTSIKIAHQLADLLRYPFRLLRARPDLVQLNSCLDRRALLRDTAFVLCTRLFRVPVLLKWHGSETHLLVPGARRIWRFLAGLVLRHVSVLGVLSSAERDEVAAFSPRTRCTVVQNPIDPARYQRRIDLRERHRLPAECTLLLFISRLIPGKGLLDVLRAMAAIGRPQLVLLVVGDGPERPAAERLVAELGLERQVCFVGRVDEARAVEYYAGCDVLVFPSTLTEGFPMTLFQSVVAGLGVVTTRLRAAVDHLQDDTHCLYVEAHDPDGIGRALVRLLDEPGILQAMRRANRSLAPRFERTSVAAHYARLYRGMTRRGSEQQTSNTQENA